MWRTLPFTTLGRAIAVISLAIAAAPALAGQSPLPQYGRTLLLEDTSDTSASVSLGDLNGDGNLDIVLAKGRHWPLVSRVLFGDGHGHFPVVRNLVEAKGRTYSARLVDVDGNGSLDVVVSNDAPDRKLIYINDGHGNFRPGSAYGDPRWPTRYVEVADLNGDSQPDIIVANRSSDRSGANFVCLNRGRGTFDANCIAFSHEPATTITATDFDRNGTIDLVVPYRDGGQSYVYLNDGHASFRQRVTFGPADAHFRMALPADVNGDGRVDLVALDENRGVFVFFQNDGGTFSTGERIGDDDATAYALWVGDLNSDGGIDVVVGGVERPSIVYFNEGSGRSFAPVQFGDGKGTVYGFALGDVDKDGVTDIAVARSGAPNVIYFGGAAAVP